MNPVATDRRQLPIGVFDSGVGGLTVLSELMKLFPEEHFVYLGDTANNPYGNRTPEEIILLTQDLVRKLDAMPVKLMVIACNTITVTPGLLEAIQRETDVPIVPMSRGAEMALQVSKVKKIGIMATVATIVSHSHEEILLSKDKEVMVVEAPCPDLAGLIEQGHVESDVVLAAVKEYIEPLQAAKVDTVILGCTHFPIIEPLLQQVTAGSMVFINPASEMGEEVGTLLEAENLKSQSGEKGTVTIYFTAAAERGQKMAEKLLSGTTFHIHEIKGE